MQLLHSRHSADEAQPTWCSASPAAAARLCTWAAAGARLPVRQAWGLWLGLPAPLLGAATQRPGNMLCRAGPLSRSAPPSALPAGTPAGRPAWVPAAASAAAPAGQHIHPGIFLALFGAHAFCRSGYSKFGSRLLLVHIGSCATQGQTWTLRQLLDACKALPDHAAAPPPGDRKAPFRVWGLGVIAVPIHWPLIALSQALQRDLQTPPGLGAALGRAACRKQQGMLA